MRRIFTAVVAVFAVTAFSSVALAQATAPAEKATTAKVEKAKPAKVADQAATKTEKAAKKAAPVATGKVAKYDAATKTLTVTTKKGDENFTLNADTKITAGAKAGTEDELVAGKNVKVHYTEANGQMTATRVIVASAAAKKSEKKEAPKKEEPKK